MSMRKAAKTYILVTMFTIAFTGAGIAGSYAQNTDTRQISNGPVSEVKGVLLGWSAKKKILGSEIYNEADEKVGEVKDIIISPDKSVSYVIVSSGGFVGLGRHDVAIAMSDLRLTKDKLILPGATKASIQALPNFEYVDS
ncbi:PRC-barrel domain-containing protein [Ampullimonas aquatilis]|uniref:PRC-barrel domain-containing protein n=1 Tax=Ampullimonas aquatilis TaxID=1341549 RepID=UPI003C716ABE